MKSEIILEKGHNTSGIYAFATFLFSNRSESINKIINTDDVDMMYIIEYIKEEFINKLQASKSITIKTNERFRNILINYGWEKENIHDIQVILRDINPLDIYCFIFNEKLKHKILFERIAFGNTSIANMSMNVKVTNLEFDTIKITDQHIPQLPHNETGCVVDLDECLNKWVDINIKQNNYLYCFKKIPHIILIEININDKTKMIDVKKFINFNNINDKIQKTLIWEFHSLILYDEEQKIYKTLTQVDDKWYILSDNCIPSNNIVCLDDQETVNQISSQTKMILYKIK